MILPNRQQQLLLGLIFLVLLGGGIGLYGVNSLNQLVASMETTQEDFRTKVIGAAQLSSYAKRAEGHLMLFLELHNEVDKQKFFQRHLSLRKTRMLLREGTKQLKAQVLLDSIDFHADVLLHKGKALLAADEKDMERTGRFMGKDHAEIIGKFHNAAARIREYGLELTEYELESHQGVHQTTLLELEVIGRNVTIGLITLMFLSLGLATILFFKGLPAPIQSKSPK